MLTRDRIDVPVTATVAVVMAPSLSSFAAIGLVPVLPQMVKVFGGQSELITLAITLPLLAAAMATALLGIVGDRFARKKVFIAAAGLFAIAAPFPLVLNSLPWVLVARFMTGIAIGGMVATSLGLIGDLFTDSRRAVLLSAQGMIASVLTIGGSALNGLLGRYGWHYAFLIYLIGVPVFFMACTLPSVSPATHDAVSSSSVVRTPFPWRSTAIIFFLSVVGILIIIPCSYELGYLFSERGIGSSVVIGNMTAVISVGAALGAALLPAVRGLPPFVAIALSFLLSSAGQGLVVVAGTNMGPLVLGALLFGAAQGLFMTVMALWLLKGLDWSVRGRATGLFRTLLYVSAFIGPHFARVATKASGSSQTTYLGYTVITLALAVILTATHLVRVKRQTVAVGA